MIHALTNKQLWIYSQSSRAWLTLGSTDNAALDDFHSSEEDQVEHATFRLFEDVFGENPWNSRTFHLYKDSNSRSWSHGMPSKASGDKEQKSK